MRYVVISIMGVRGEEVREVELWLLVMVRGEEGLCQVLANAVSISERTSCLLCVLAKYD